MQNHEKPHKTLSENESYSDSILWRESKRLRFTIIIIIASLISLFFESLNSISNSERILLLCIWFFGANISYCSGWGLEIFVRFYSIKFNKKDNVFLRFLINRRPFIYFLGALFSILWTMTSLII